MQSKFTHFMHQKIIFKSILDCNKKLKYSRYLDYSRPIG